MPAHSSFHRVPTRLGMLRTWPLAVDVFLPGAVTDVVAVA
jgi:hypothetical protein